MNPKKPDWLIKKEEAEMEKAALKVHYELDEAESARIEEDESSE